MSMELDSRRVHADLRDAREGLLGVASRLSAGDSGVSRPGGWDAAACCCTHRVGSDLREAHGAHDGRRAADAASMLASTRAAILDAVEGVDADTLYSMTKVGHEEYSPLSLLENIASHERDHGAQIAELVVGAVEWASPAPTAVAGITIRAASIDDLAADRDSNHYDGHCGHVRHGRSPSGASRVFGHYADRAAPPACSGARWRGARYASTSKFHPRSAYDTTVEMTALYAPEAVGQASGSGYTRRCSRRSWAKTGTRWR
jgi:hypothetical protein